MSRSVRQHVVPASYLRLFADKAGRISAFDLEQELLWNVHPKVFLRERHRYTLRDDGRDDFELEAQLGEVESLVAPVFRRVISDATRSVSEADLAAIHAFAAAQICRGSRGRRLTRKWAADAGRHALIDPLVASGEWTEEEALRVDVELIGDSATLLPWRDFYDKTYEDLQAIAFGSVQTLEGSVFTSDEPVSLDLENERLVGATLPLSPRHIFRSGDRAVNAACPIHGFGADDEFARSQAVHTAERWVISHPNDADLLEETARRHRTCWTARQARLGEQLG